MPDGDYAALRGAARGARRTARARSWTARAGRSGRHDGHPPLHGGTAQGPGPHLAAAALRARACCPTTRTVVVGEAERARGRLGSCAARRQLALDPARRGADAGGRRQDPLPRTPRPRRRSSPAGTGASTSRFDEPQRAVTPGPGRRLLRRRRLPGRRLDRGAPSAPSRRSPRRVKSRERIDGVERPARRLLLGLLLGEPSPSATARPCDPGTPRGSAGGGWDPPRPRPRIRAPPRRGACSSSCSALFASARRVAARSRGRARTRRARSDGRPRSRRRGRARR